MLTISTLLPWAQIALSVLLIGAIVLQRSDAGLGAAFGGQGFSIYKKRGLEKYLFIATIVFACLYIVSTIFALFR